MRAIEIEIFNVWKDGASVPVKYLGIEVSKDNLYDAATFRWSLFQTYSQGNMTNLPVTSGALTMDGTDYANWNNAVDINYAAFQWVATELNLKLK